MLQTRPDRPAPKAPYNYTRILVTAAILGQLLVILYLKHQVTRQRILLLTAHLATSDETHGPQHGSADHGWDSRDPRTTTTTSIPGEGHTSSGGEADTAGASPSPPPANPPQPPPPPPPSPAPSPPPLPSDAQPSTSSTSTTTSASTSSGTAPPTSLFTHEGFRRRVAQLETDPEGRPLPSRRFAPLRVTVCLDHMPRHWAPCLAKSLTNVDIEYAEEVIYPPVKVRLPGFVHKGDKERWLKQIGTRGLAPKEDGMYIPIQTQGQNFILRNVRYANNPFHNDWEPKGGHLMGQNTEIRQFEQTSPQPGDKVHDELFLANTPQSGSYQHFSDHVPKIMMQALHMMTNQTDIITGYNEIPSILEAWTWFGLNASRVTYKDQPTYGPATYTYAPPHFARRLIHAARTPFWGPYNLQRWAEQVLGPKASTVPMTDRKVVLYYSRTEQLMRRVLNEEALLANITALLTRRGRGETLVRMNFSNFSSYREFVTYVNRNVRAFVGPHGGGMLNLQWLARDTLVLEFQHYAHINYAMWEFAPFLEQNYWVFQYLPEGENDMRVNVTAVVELLDGQLGRVAPEGEYLAHDYDWNRALEGA